jgi:hypothetical protein
MAQNIHSVGTVPRLYERLVVPQSGTLGGARDSSLHRVSRVSSPSRGMTVYC